MAGAALFAGGFSECGRGSGRPPLEADEEDEDEARPPLQSLDLSRLLELGPDDVPRRALPLALSGRFRRLRPECLHALDTTAVERLAHREVDDALRSCPNLRDLGVHLAPTGSLPAALRRADRLERLVLQGPFVGCLRAVAEAAGAPPRLRELAVDGREWPADDRPGLAALLRAARRLRGLRLGPAGALGPEQAADLVGALLPGGNLRALEELEARVDGGGRSAALAALAPAVHAALASNPPLRALRLRLDSSFASALPAAALLAAFLARSAARLARLALHDFQLLDTAPLPAPPEGPPLRLALLDYSPAALADAEGPAACPAPRRLLSAPALEAFRASCWTPALYPPAGAWGRALAELAVDSPEEWAIAAAALASCPHLRRLRFRLRGEAAAPPPPGPEERAGLARLEALALRGEGGGEALAAWLAAALAAAPCGRLREAALAVDRWARPEAAGCFWEALGACCPRLEAAEGPWCPPLGRLAALLPRLRSLGLRPSEGLTGEEAAGLLAACPRLEALHLDACPLGPPLARAARRHPCLARLSLADAGGGRERLGLEASLALLASLPTPPREPLLDPI